MSISSVYVCEGAFERQLDNDTMSRHGHRVNRKDVTVSPGLCKSAKMCEHSSLAGRTESAQHAAPFSDRSLVRLSIRTDHVPQYQSRAYPQADPQKADRSFDAANQSRGQTSLPRSCPIKPHHQAARQQAHRHQTRSNTSRAPMPWVVQRHMYQYGTCPCRTRIAHFMT